MEWQNNPMFCILKDTLDTEKLVEIVENARLANTDYRCVVCGERDTVTDEKCKENHAADCLIGVIEMYLTENGFWSIE
jgi:hypothetical protein